MSGDKGMRSLFSAVLICAFSFSFSVSAQQIPAETYARFAESNQILLSPDGSKIAVWSNYVSDMGRAVQINVINRADNSTTAAATRAIDFYEIQKIFWVDNNHLLLQYFHPDNYFYRNEIIAIDGSGEVRELDFGPVVDILRDEPGYLLTTLGENDRGLYRIGTFERAIDQQDDEQETLWITDANQDVRIRINFEDDIEVDYRPPGENGYERIAKYDALDPNYLWPVGFTADPNLFLAYKQHEGKRSLFQVNMASGTPQAQLLVHDPARHLQGELLKDSGSGAAVGFNFESERATVLWSGSWASLMQQLQPALPGNSLRLTQVNSETGDYLVLATAPDNRGTWLLGNIKTGELRPLLPRVPALAEQAPIQASTRWISGSNGETIEAILYRQAGQELGDTPMVVMAGLGSGFEDNYAFDPMAHMLASRSAAVLAVDIGGLNTRSVTMLDAVDTDWHSMERLFAGTPEKWIPEQNQRLADAVNWAVGQGIADEDRLCLLGNQFGANASLMLANQLGEDISCAIGISPYVKLADLILELRYVILDNFTDYYPDPRYTQAELREKDYYLANFYWNRYRRFFTERNAMLNDMSPLDNYEGVQAPLLLVHDSETPEIYRGGGEIDTYMEKLDEEDKPYQWLDISNNYLQGYSLTTREQIFAAVDEFVQEQLGL